MLFFNAKYLNANQLYLCLQILTLEEKSILKPSMNYGAMLGVVLVEFSLIVYLVDMQANKFVGFLNYALLIGGVFYAQNNFKTTTLGGYISYGKAFGLGALTVAFASLISTVYFYVFVTFVDSGVIDIALEQAYIDMAERGMSDEEVEQAMEYTSMFMTPGMMSVMAFFASGIFGLIISSITSIFVKREDPTQIV